MRKFVIPCFAILFTLASFCFALLAHAGDLPAIPLETTTVQAERIPGDANGDRSVDLRDAAMIVRYIVGGWNVQIDTSAADVNADGSVDMRDAALITRCLAGGWGVVLQ